ncbi:drug resistance transporter%2C Bcr/CflA subfamily [Yersinia intermedia]|nr:drug resistance transporter%2C Bcr/CflA subfamily [Yersinia intermedia]
MLNQQAQTQSATAKKTGLSFLLILSALMAVTSLSTDIYLPAMPVMAKDLQGDAELTITGFLIAGDRRWKKGSCRVPVFYYLTKCWLLRTHLLLRLKVI